MFKDLLVPVVLGEVSPEAFDLACALAAEQGGHVTGLVSISVVTPMVEAMNKMGPMKMVQKTESVSTDTISPDLFKIPEGYTVEKK